MRITADTNVLLRATLRDDRQQAAAAEALLARATVITVPVPVFCEFAWVLQRSYRQSATHVAAAIRAICAIDAVVTDNPAVDAGLNALLAGGDFADGAIAQQGESLGGRMFVTFDRAAITILGQAGLSAADPAQIVD